MQSTTLSTLLRVLLLLAGPAVTPSNAFLDCSFQETVQLQNDLFLDQIANYEEGTFTMQLTYTGGESWVGIGINTDGKNKMTPANAVIGRAFDDGTTSALEYSMTSDNEDASGVQPLSTQTLTAARFLQAEGVSQLLFTKPLSDAITEDSMWIYGVGLEDNQWQGKHKIDGSFRFSFTSCVEIRDTPSPTVATASPTGTPTKTPTKSPSPTQEIPPTISPLPTLSPEPSALPTTSP
eukprot:CAMPEP_0116997268 /NCGR_PEP_ID=MMETSP0472-20121206/763_1 /TAXON_ID=693140 ORGANISM="Tiarina fusus, Strain LIS" /NCGR_SAMPLE_ID=MMETSP0472 /ASSEMBLY_ACC=CAM_ASM_000603 /LENGTH=235 /DNA_ID=CAMNT_0004696097 /DNA_START=154 /DNA_END=857 /DNA_ORIENTATION=+